MKKLLDWYSVSDHTRGSAAIHDREMVEKCRVIKEQKIAIAELEKALDRETEDIGNSLTVLDTKEKILAETKDKLETALNDVQAKSDEVLMVMEHDSAKVNQIVELLDSVLT